MEESYIKKCRRRKRGSHDTREISVRFSNGWTLLLKFNDGGTLIGDYATCFEPKSGESIQESSQDPSVQVMKLYLDNKSRLGPNIACLLLIFDANKILNYELLQHQCTTYHLEDKVSLEPRY